MAKPTKLSDIPKLRGPGLTVGLKDLEVGREMDSFRSGPTKAEIKKVEDLKAKGITQLKADLEEALELLDEHYLDEHYVGTKKERRVFIHSINHLQKLTRAFLVKHGYEIRGGGDER